MKQLHELTVLEAHAGLRAHEFTAAQLTEACLQRIHELNPTLNAFITVTEDLARAEAKIADERLANGTAEALTDPCKLDDIQELERGHTWNGQAAAQQCQATARHLAIRPGL